MVPFSASVADIAVDLDEVLTALIETGTPPSRGELAIKQFGRKLLRTGGPDALLASAQLIVARNLASATRHRRIDILQSCWTNLETGFSENPTARLSITSFPPLVCVCNERKARIRHQRRLRNVALRQRKSDAKKRRHGDQVHFYQVPLLDSEINVLVADLNIIERADDRSIISDREWQRLVGRAIAVAARSAIKNK